MRFAYCDDAGNTGLRLDDPQQPYHLFGCVIFEEKSWRSIRKAVDACCERHFRAWGVDPKAEIHATDIWNSSAHFKHLKVAPDAKIAFFRDLIESAKAAGGFEYLWGAADKPRLREYSRPWSPIEVAAWMLIERISEYLHKAGDDAVVVADRNMQAERVIQDFVLKYRTDGPIVGSFRSDLDTILDNVHFLDSEQSRHIQLVDVLNYIKIRQLKRAVNKHGFNGLFCFVDSARGKIFPFSKT